jgi:uncharacterized Tic20 family protein
MGGLIGLASAIPPALFCFILPVSLAIILAHTLAAVKVYNGRDFCYPWLGKYVEAFLRD